jgi:hypothetical protein
MAGGKTPFRSSPLKDVSGTPLGFAAKNLGKSPPKVPSKIELVLQLLERLGLDPSALKALCTTTLSAFVRYAEHAANHTELDSIAQRARLQGRHDVADRALNVKIAALARDLGVGPK